MSAPFEPVPAGTSEPAPAGTRAMTLVLYWGSLAVGALLPWVLQISVDVSRRRHTLESFFDGLYVRLFGPDSGLLFLSLLGAAPFAVFAVFALIHLGTAPRRGALVTRRRRFALLVAAAAMLGVSIWGHLAILTARGSTAGIGFLFLPFYVLIAMLVAYGLARWIAARWIR